MLQFMSRNIRRKEAYDNISVPNTRSAKNVQQKVQKDYNNFITIFENESSLFKNSNENNQVSVPTCKIYKGSFFYNSFLAYEILY